MIYPYIIFALSLAASIALIYYPSKYLEPGKASSSKAYLVAFLIFSTINISERWFSFSSLLTYLLFYWCVVSLIVWLTLKLRLKNCLMVGGVYIIGKLIFVQILNMIYMNMQV